MSGSDLLDAGVKLGGTIGSAFIGGSSADKAAEQQIAGLEAGQQISQEAVRQARGDILATAEPGLEDLISGFQGAISVLDEPGQAEQKARALSGALGPEARQMAITEMIQGPGQQFLEKQQEDALIRNAAAIGGLGGGRVRSALQEEAFGRAATQEQQRFENLLQVSIPEQQRSANIANLLSGGGGQLASFRAGLGANLADITTGGSAQQIPLATGTGVAQAAGTLGFGGAVQQGIGGVSKTLGELL